MYQSFSVKMKTPVFIVCYQKIILKYFNKIPSMLTSIKQYILKAVWLNGKNKTIQRNKNKHKLILLICAI